MVCSPALIRREMRARSADGYIHVSRRAIRIGIGKVYQEICVTFPVLQTLQEGYEVQVSADASASWSKLGNELALRRMENAGASDLPVILAELQ